MIFATPWGLLALLAIPAIVGIHLFRRRFPVRPTAGLFLWQLERRTPDGGGRIEKLPVTASLILECLAALALALILAGARLSSAAVSPHLVVLLDDSASMAAVDASGERARDRAVQRVEREIERLGATGRLTLVLSGDRPSVLAGPAALPRQAREALETWTPEAAHHSLALGLRLARELAGPMGNLIVLSDVAPTNTESALEGLVWAALGEPLPNAGIVSAQRSIASTEGSVASLTLGNYSGSGIRRRLSITAGEREVFARDIELPAGTSSVNIPLPAGVPTVRVALNDDALARDNVVVLAEPRPSIVGVENRLPDGRGRAALAKAIDALSGVTMAESGHLAFIDAMDLEKPTAPGVWRVAFGRPPAAWIASGEARDFVGPFVLEKRHPLLVGVTLGGIVWTGALPTAAGMVRPLASAGDYTLIGTAAISNDRAAEPTTLFNIDLDRTNLIRAPDWPILISNVVEMRRQSLAGPERWNYRVGEWIRIRLGRDPKAALRLRYGTNERSLPSARDLEFLAPSPGGVLEILEGDHVLFELGVNFLDESESDLRRQSTASFGESSEPAGRRLDSAPHSDPLFWILLAIGSTALIANWVLVSPKPQRA